MTGLGVTLVGSAVFFLTVGFGEARDIQRITGDFLFLAATACWSIYTLMGKKILRQISPLVATAYAMLFGSLVIGVFSVRDLVAVQWARLSLDFWVSQFYLALFPSVLANWFYYLGVKRIGPSRAAVFMYIVPVSGLVLAAIMISDVLTVAQIAGSVLMLLGLSIVNRRSGR
ncbi:DMT family transporter [Paenibacillus sp. P26]|nr:DMT family transporter [Paenibacillus sp. P26]UUZ93376.1 DMT family transporter [Paenibacillus sp. P25]